MQHIAVDLNECPTAPDAAPLRVLIDARKLGHGGIGSYIENLVTGLLKCGGVQLSLLARPHARDQYAFGDHVTWLADTTPLYSLRELIGLRHRIGRESFDIFHAPHYTLPFGLAVPTVVTIHDIIHVSHPEKFYYPVVGGALIRSAVSRASHVMTVSEHTRSQVIQLTGVTPSKITHIPNAVVSSFMEAAAVPDVGQPANKGQPYLLAVFSTIKPHKGLADLLVAYRTFREMCSPQAASPDLILVGYGTGKIAESRVLSELQASTPGVKVLGSVATADMARLYQGARCLVVPSLAEGFCLPALEAQAFGTSVVCRPVPALKEILTAKDTVAADFSMAALVKGLYDGFQRSLSEPREANKGIFERFAPVVIAQQVKKIYQQVHQAQGMSGAKKVAQGAVTGSAS
jgi:glycosyltransferase involved in cell wall biosynthesis